MRQGSEFEKLDLVWDEEEAKGVVTIEQAAWGLAISVNGKCIAGIDLFHLSEAGADEDGSQYPQIVLYTGNDADEPVAHARWYKDRCQVTFEGDVTVELRQLRGVDVSLPTSDPEVEPCGPGR